ncbi:MAG TPA: SRPBCC domain-containing protein [Kofleriaceae bacterium]|nr:SRPBCC domain-containing protein [Kofleriaceae bacterium]
MTSVKKQIVVETSQQRAFRTFTDGIDRWWPREHHIGQSPLERMIVEPRVGGRWYSICKDGSEVDVGKVVAWEPPQRLVLTWQITAQWQYDPAFSTEIEVSFIAENPRRTRVELEHRQLERYAADAEAMKKTFEHDDAWAASLHAFAGASTRNKFLMIYETTPEGLTKAREHLPAHRDRLDQFQARGTLLMAGPAMDGTGRAFGVFTTREAAEEFIAGDPFIVHQVVARSTVVEWSEVLF